jgi:hypothetical protein
MAFVVLACGKARNRIEGGQIYGSNFFGKTWRGKNSARLCTYEQVRQ